MKKREQQYNDPWDRNSYETGSTKPPKDRGGIVAVLLVALLLVGSLCSALGILNVKLLQMLRESENAETVTLFDDDATQPDSQHDHIFTTDTPVTMKLHHPPLTAPELPEGGTFPWLVLIRCDQQTGSGIVMTEDGFIITNAHLVSKGAVTVTFDNGLQLTATRIGADETQDVAVLQVQATGLTPAAFGDASLVREGDALLLIGENWINSFAGAGGKPESWADSAVVMNGYSQIVAIPTKNSSTLLMTNDMKPVVDRILEAALAKKADLCLSGCTVSEFDHRYYDLPYGVLVTLVEEGGCGEAAGVRAGDVITAADRKKIRTKEDLEQLIAGYQAGDPIKIDLYRPLDGKTSTVELVLSEAKE